MVVRKLRRAGGADVAPVTAAVVAATVAVTGLGGCAGAADAPPAGAVVASGRPVSDGAGQGRAGGRGAEAVRAAADALARAGTSKARTSMEMTTGGTRLTVRGEGGYDFRARRGRVQVLLPEDAGRPQRRITEVFTPGALYMKNRGAGVPADKWVRVDTATLPDGNLVTGGATDPAAAAELLRAARQVALVGPASVGGVPVTHYRGTTDIGAAAKTASPQVRGALAAAAKGFATDAVAFDAYLDDEGRLRKVRHRFRFANGAGEVGVESTTELYDFGTPVGVRLPPSRDIYAGRIEG
ncbi:hypothetical protein [Streptomyces sp. DH12]|uniref:hypothetical protein n=1 Tax=Streptomyces sp. DH12 TaxID=2857010 RepID=UPI001E2EBEE7|nr:hypothetical protein [Streptomyces sp. DH12]